VGQGGHSDIIRGEAGVYSCLAHTVEHGDGFFGPLGHGANGHDFLEGGGVGLQAQGDGLVD